MAKRSIFAALWVTPFFIGICQVSCICPQYDHASLFDLTLFLTFHRYGAWVLARANALSSSAFVSITILPSLQSIRISGQLSQPPASAITSCLISDQSNVNSNFLFDLGVSWPFAKSLPISALQLQLLVARKLVVTISTLLFPAGELQGTVESLSCYDGSGSLSIGGNHSCHH